MGGYADYVWPSYGLTLGVIVLNIVWRGGCWPSRARTRAAVLAMRGEENNDSAGRSE